MSTDAARSENWLTVEAPEPPAPRLDALERWVSGGVSMIVLITALVVVLLPVDRRVILPACTGRGQECVVAVDADLSTVATALVAVAAVAALVGILGVRFGTLKGLGLELGSGWSGRADGLRRFEAEKRDVPFVPSQEVSSPGVRPEETPPQAVVAAGLPLDVKIETPGKELGVAPVATAHLLSPMAEIDPSVLRDYQSGRRASQRSYFLTHVLGPPRTKGQEYSVAIKVVPHRSATEEIRSVSFFLGRSWGNRVFPAGQGRDGRFGIVTEAYGPFLALCEIEFEDGARILLDHFCDFESGRPVPS